MGKERDASIPIEETDESTVILPEEYRGGIGEEELEAEGKSRILPT